jgi:DNA primase
MSFQNRNTGNSFEVNVVQNVIDKANSTISLINVIGLYVNVDDHTRKICCPFQSHNGGNERTPSLYIYLETNSYFCFGCKSYGRVCDFYAAMENITPYVAALRLLDNLCATVDINDRGFTYDKEVLEFSSMIRNFLMHHPNNAEALKYAENLCVAFDALRDKHSQEEMNFNKLFLKINSKLREFKCYQVF